MTEQQTDPHWELKTALAQIHDGFNAFYAAVVNGSYAELARQQIPVLENQEAELGLIERNRATLRDMQRQIDVVETRMAALELDWIARKPPEA